MESSYESWEISDEGNYILWKFQKPEENWPRSKGTIGNGMKFFEYFEENRVAFVEEFTIIKIWRIFPIWLLEQIKLVQNFPSVHEKLKKLRNILRFFDKNLYGKLTFPQFY